MPRRSLRLFAAGLALLAVLFAILAVVARLSAAALTLSLIVALVCGILVVVRSGPTPPPR